MDTTTPAGFGIQPVGYRNAPARSTGRASQRRVVRGFVSIRDSFFLGRPVALAGTIVASEHRIAMRSDYEQMTKAELIAELEALHSAVSFFVFDTEGKTLAVNATGAELLGREREDFVGTSFLPFVV